MEEFPISQESLDKMALCHVSIKKLQNQPKGIRVANMSEGSRKLAKHEGLIMATRNSVLRKKHPEDFMQEGLRCHEENCKKTMKYYSSYKRQVCLFVIIKFNN